MPWILFLFGVVLADITNGSLLGRDDQCNWSGSSRYASTPSVYKAEFYCLSGAVSWSSPSGGLRVIFHAPPIAKGAKFQVCLLLSNQGINAFQEIAGGLKLLRSRSREQDETPLCVRSQNKEVVIYFEPSRHHPIGALRIDYELEVDQEGGSTIQTTKKCSPDELARVFCSSDFAVEGTISKFTYDARHRSRQIDIKANLVYHQSAHIFRPIITHVNDEASASFGIVTAPWNFRLDTDHKYMLMGNMTQEHGASLLCTAKYQQWKDIMPNIRCH